MNKASQSQPVLTPKSAIGDAEPSAAGAPQPPTGWNSLDDLPGDGDQVEGLLSDGRTTDAEWWGPVPRELWGPDGQDGSGWAFDGTPFENWARDLELVAWRPYGAARASGPASPQGDSGRNP